MQNEVIRNIIIPRRKRKVDASAIGDTFFSQLNLFVRIILNEIGETSGIVREKVEEEEVDEDGDIEEQRWDG